MKKKSSFISVLLPAMLITVMMLAFTSCKKEKQGDTNPPEIEAVTDLTNRSLSLTAANYGDWIIIKGDHLATTFKVEFNTIMAADSLIYADDSTVTVKIPGVLPDPANNPITVTTKYGTATFNFRILQPPPTITSFDPMAGPEGQVVTINGLNFGGVTNVKFGSIDATVISGTKEELKVNVPAGVLADYIYVTTGSGSTRSEYRYGLKYELFTDALTSGWTFSPSSSNVTYNVNVADTIKRGSRSVRIDFKAAWSYLRFVKVVALSTTGYQGVKFSMYAPEGFLDKKLRIYLNGSTTATYTITVTKVNQWLNYEIPLTSLGNPSTITQVIFNEFSGTAVFPRKIYVDDLGLY